MDTLWDALITAFGLVLRGDGALVEISARSLFITLSAVVVAMGLTLPLAAWLAMSPLGIQRFVVAALNALTGLPPVVVGLVVFLMLSRAGPLGVLGLLYTPWAMIVAQAVVVAPLIASVAHQALREIWAEYRDLLLSLGAGRWQCVVTLLWDGRRGLLTAALVGFGRGIGEVGAVMIVGGNIENATRVLTTAIALETGKGDFALALALGLVLIALSLAVSFAMHVLARTERSPTW